MAAKKRKKQKRIIKQKKTIKQAHRQEIKLVRVRVEHFTPPELRLREGNIQSLMQQRNISRDHAERIFEEQEKIRLEKIREQKIREEAERKAFEDKRRWQERRKSAW